MGHDTDERTVWYVHSQHSPFYTPINFLKFITGSIVFQSTPICSLPTNASEQIDGETTRYISSWHFIVLCTRVAGG